MPFTFKTFRAIEPLLASGFLTNKDVVQMLSTNKADTLEPGFKLLRESSKLLHYVVRGDEDRAKAMIEANPELLLYKSKAEDYSGRTIIGTPFQAAIGAGDALMWEMMIPYFNKLQSDRVITSAQEVMKQQYEQQFSVDWKRTESKESLKAYYEGLADMIAQGSDVCDQALRAFRANLTRQKEIRFGHHFDINHLTAAYQAYVDKYDDLRTWANQKRFWVEVIGFVQSQLPANHAQAHCSGLKNVADDFASLKRGLKLYNGDSFYDLGLGRYFAVYSYSRAAPHVAGADFAAARGGHPASGAFKKICEAITQRRERLVSLLERGFECEPGSTSHYLIVGTRFF